MSQQLTSIDDYEAPKKNAGTIVFVRSKACPLTFKPIGGLLTYKSGYDPILKRNREPEDGEKASTRYMVNGLDATGTIKVFDVGSQVVTAIKKVRQFMTSQNLNPDCAVTITARGTGLDTEYDATPSTNKALNAMQAESSKMHDLQAVAYKLLNPQPKGIAPLTEEEDDAHAFAA
jgi:hypothetical protein